LPIPKLPVNEDTNARDSRRCKYKESKSISVKEGWIFRLRRDCWTRASARFDDSDESILWIIHDFTMRVNTQHSTSQERRYLVLEMSRIIQLIETHEITRTEYRSVVRRGAVTFSQNSTVPKITLFQTRKIDSERLRNTRAPDLILNSIPRTHGMIVRDSAGAEKIKRIRNTRRKREKETDK